jgi:hypothetical protein
LRRLWTGQWNFLQEKIRVCLQTAESGLIAGTGCCLMQRQENSGVRPAISLHLSAGFFSGTLLSKTAW